MLLQMVPIVKNNITQSMNYVQFIEKEILENIRQLPENEDIKENIEPLLEALAIFEEAEAVNDIRNLVVNHVENIPSNEEVVALVQQAFDYIPPANYINSKLDELVAQ